MSVVDRLRERRAGQFLSFCSVGGVGMIIDLAITVALLGSLPPVAANAAGWSVAVTHNFAGNYVVTFDRPDGSVARQYAAYVAVHAVTFAFRALVLSAVLATTPLPATAASVVGIGAAAGLNFLASERVFGVRGGAVATINAAVHRLWNSRLRRVLVVVKLYHVVFRVYARVLHLVTPGVAREITAGGVTVSLPARAPTETVSLLHTAENEGTVLDQFVADLEPGDRVCDVGANLGVYTALATTCGARVDAVEAHPPTAARLRETCPDATVHACALGASVGTVGLAVRNDAVGTQRAAVGGDTMTVRQLPGDRLAAPDVLKIDVEGAEVGVLDGFARTLDRGEPRVVFIETHGDVDRVRVQYRLRIAGYEIAETWSVGSDETMLRAVLANPFTGAAAVGSDMPLAEVSQ